MTESVATRIALEEMGYEIYSPLDVHYAIEDMTLEQADKLGRRIEELMR